MRFFPLTIVLALMLAHLCPQAPANEPKKMPDVENIPAPQQKIVPGPILEPIPDMIYLPPMPRPGTREVWQYYGVDGMGRFRPRVILSPAGAYYMQTGQPYPWPTNRPTRIMPIVVD